MYNIIDILFHSCLVISQLASRIKLRDWLILNSPRRWL